MKALAWFRGWTREQDVQKEFANLEDYVKTSLEQKQTADAERAALLGSFNYGTTIAIECAINTRRYQDFGTPINCDVIRFIARRYQLFGLLSSILEKRTLYPLFIMAVASLVNCIAQNSGLTTYELNFFEWLHLPLDPYFLMVSYNNPRRRGDLPGAISTEEARLTNIISTYVEILVRRAFRATCWHADLPVCAQVHR